MIYNPPIIANYGEENRVEECIDHSKREKGTKLLRKALKDRAGYHGYGVCGGPIGVSFYAAANVAAVVNVVAYANAAVATLLAVVLAVFPSNAQK